MENEIDEFLNAISKLKIWVAGDVMLDTYWVGKASRISPEAPVPVVHVQERNDRAGGAANVAMNLSRLGARVHLFSMVGKDEAGDRLIQMLEQEGIGLEGVFHTAERPTTQKNRIMAQRQQMLRYDVENVFPLTEKEWLEGKLRMEGALQKARPDWLILQDYNKGFLTPTSIDFWKDASKQHAFSVAADPKFYHFQHYQGVSLLKPNLKELAEALDLSHEMLTNDYLYKHGSMLRTRCGAEHFMVTLAERGIFYQNKDSQGILPTRVRLLSDVSGAGDTVIAVATLALACGKTLAEAARLANIAAGCVCELPGVSPISRELLRNAG